MDHLPLHCQEKIYARSGVSLVRSTICNWVEESTSLLKYIVESMAKDARNAHCVAIDATGVLVQAKEKCRRGYFWVMVADHDHVLFRFTLRHVQDGPKEFLRGYKGYVLADASSVYERRYEDEDVTAVGCWAHSRRRFYDALTSDKERSLAGIGFIGQLYEIDNDIKKKDLAPAVRAGHSSHLAFHGFSPSREVFFAIGGTPLFEGRVQGPADAKKTPRLGGLHKTTRCFV